MIQHCGAFANHFCRSIPISFKHECVSLFLVVGACSILNNCLWPVWIDHIFTYLINGTTFREKIIECEIHILIHLQLLSETFLFKKIQPDIVIIDIVLRVNCLYYCQILFNFEFLPQILKDQISWQIRLLGAELFRAVCHTDKEP